jgi:hypothetical protein
MLWIGGFKHIKCETENIIPFVVNSSTLSFLMNDPGDYTAPKNPEVALVPQIERGTYRLPLGLGGEHFDRLFAASFASCAPLKITGALASPLN